MSRWQTSRWKMSWWQKHSGDKCPGEKHSDDKRPCDNHPSSERLSHKYKMDFCKVDLNLPCLCGGNYKNSCYRNWVNFEVNNVFIKNNNFPSEFNNLRFLASSVFFNFCSWGKKTLDYILVALQIDLFLGMVRGYTNYCTGETNYCTGETTCTAIDCRRRGSNYWSRDTD